MGCNLCSLQKREEHYKLLYEIAQVNGRDLSRASHEEALEAFRSAKEPVVVQVLRRAPVPRGQRSQLVDVCTQTEITFEHIMALAKLRPLTPPVPDICPFLLSDSGHSLHTLDQEYLEGSEFLSSLPADAERTEDFEYEEVELCRVCRQDKLGLTLCYRTDDEEEFSIFVTEVEPNSIAGRDGRIREGDRILQINGRDIQDRQEAVGVLSNEESRNIVLLVARPDIQEEPWLEDEHSEFLEELKMEMLEEQRREEEEEEKKARAAGEESITASCSYSPEQILQTDPSEKSVLSQIQKRLSRCLRPDQISPSETPEAERFQQLLELKCQIRNSGEYDLLYRRSIQCGGAENELRLLNQELRSIQIQCQNIMQRHKTDSKLPEIQEHPERSDKDSSSAYNTAESSRSTPLATERSPEHRTLSRHPESSIRSASPDHSNPSESPDEISSRSLHSRIPVHQCRSYMQMIQEQAALEFGMINMSVPQEDNKMEWKVKVRSDGTRYITKRPVRDRLLRERALKIKEERSGGMTTDDDTMSEMKMGRYWSKEERKQQLLRAKEQRRRREMMQRGRTDTHNTSIMEISQRRSTKRRNRRILDSWITIQEMLSHGHTAAAEGAREHSAFLSVTTV
ncbi:PDZ domain-containing RING finger protein 4 [Danio aesculapii]|uniref:PDZ domain-containing RING finger protein 4 n=1 Tax=Danio aesculapii TaxID=1142201 RepID=UPI0024BF3902|nr:PDZ domain-containing RING finger protein 4 [Danio aesculapii]